MLRVRRPARLAALIVGGVALGLLATRSTGAPPAPAPPPRLPAEAALAWDIRDADTDERIPCKLTLVGVKGTPTPAMTHNDIGRQEGDAICAHDRIMSATGVGVARVPAGIYDVYVSRGPEWDLLVKRAVVVRGAGATVAGRLRHVVDSRGWVSADFHVHASASPDSRVPMQDRIYEFLSDGVEVITSTDHNVVVDYAPLIAELGVGARITSVVGDEMTTGSWGHYGAFPLPQALEQAGQGAVLVHGRTPREMFADVRRLVPGAILNVHHPRIDREIGYFNLGGYDAATDHAKREGFSLAFDALEVLNGYQDPERKHVDLVIRDWLQLLDHGHLVTATGNSDTHHLDHNIGGYPRNYLRVPDDRPAAVTPAQLAAALRAHQSFFTTAPFVRVEAGDVGIGGVARATSGSARLAIEVQAAPWVSVSRLTLLQSGREPRVVPLPASTGRVRYSDHLDVPVERDGWVVVRVDGDEPLAPIVGDRVRFDVRPLALTNPIFLDRDGDGRYTAPRRAGP